MKRTLTVLLILFSAAGYSQDTPYIKPVVYTNMNAAGYQFKQIKVDTSATVKKLLVRDSSAFQGVVTVPTLGDSDSSKKAANTAWVRKYISENITPGIPGMPTPTWQFTGNYTPSDPTLGRLGFRDSTPLYLITNDQIRFTIPDNGIQRNTAAVNKVLLIDTITKALYYGDAGSGSGGLDTTKIPLSGTIVGKPVTGDIEFQDGRKLTSTNGDFTSIVELSPSDNWTRLRTTSNLTDEYGQIIVDAGGITFNSKNSTDERSAAFGATKGFFSSEYFPNKDSLTYAQMKDISDSVVGKLNISDTAAMLAPYARLSSGGVPYLGATQNVDLGDYALRANSLETRLNITSTAQYSFGNSITVGQGATVPSTGGYAYLLASSYGLPITNYALSGSGIWRSAASHNININAGHTSLATVMAGFNDVRRGGASRTTLNKIIWGLNAIIANQYLKSNVAAGNGSGVARFGTGWAVNYNSQSVGGKSAGTTGAFTNVVNDSIVYTFTDSTVVVGLITADGVTNQYSDFTVYIDNVSQGSFTENFQTDGISDGVNDNKRTPMALIFRGLTNTTHKIKLVNNSASASKFLVVDYFGNLIDSTAAQPLLIFHAPRMNAAGYATAPALANNAVIDTLNSKIDSLVANYTNTYPIKVALTNNYYDTLTGLSVDNIHPNNTGHNQIKNAGLAVLATTGVVPPVSNNKAGSSVLGNGSLGRPFLSFYKASATTNNKLWDYYADSNYVAFRMINDANTSSNDWLRATRNGTTSTEVAITSPILSLTNGLFRINATNAAGFLSQSTTLSAWATNRNPVTGVFTFTGAAAAQVVLNSSSGNGAIDFYTTNTNNTTPPLIATISATGVRATQYRLSALNTAPASATATGTLGEIRIDANYIYVCTATNTWVRASLSTW